MSILYFKKLSNKATTPTRGSSESAGLDLYSVGNYTIMPGDRLLIPTDIAFGIPKGYYLRAAPRSGLAVKSGIDLLAGVIDVDYIGHVRILLINLGIINFNIEVGDRIAQVILEKIDIPQLVEVEDLEETERGSEGFGSTGL